MTQCQQIISAWQVYPQIREHKAILHPPTEGPSETAAGQSLVHAVSEGPFVQTGVMYCPQLKLFFPAFCVPFFPSWSPK